MATHITLNENTRVRTARNRPAGWIAPGPVPAGPGEREDLWPAEDEDLCYLAGDWRIFQKLDGHRWSLDDLLTAWFAVQHAPDPVLHALDLGCGIGSVLMMVAWAFPQARCVGVEAQAVSAGLARRSVAYNGAASRVEVMDGDLRDLSGLDLSGLEAQGFDLITGTPPYIPPGEGVISDKVQCGPCRFELRGGVEAYVEAAARRLSVSGVFVCCAGAQPTMRGRVEAALPLHGLHLWAACDVIPKTGKQPLMSLFAARRTPPASAPQRSTITIRDTHGARTPEYQETRARMGLPP